MELGASYGALEFSRDFEDELSLKTFQENIYELSKLLWLNFEMFNVNLTAWE